MGRKEEGMAVKYQRYWDSDEKKYKYKQISGFDEPKKTTKQIYQDSLKTDYKGFTGSGTTSAKERKLESKAKTAQKKTTTDWKKSRAGAQGQATTKTAAKKADKVQFDFDNIFAPKKVGTTVGKSTDNTDILFSSPFENRVKLGEELTAAKAGMGKSENSFNRQDVLNELNTKSILKFNTLSGSKGIAGGARYSVATDDELRKYASLSGEEQENYLKELDSILDERLGTKISEGMQKTENTAQKNVMTSLGGFVAGYDEAMKGIEQVGRGVLGDEAPVQRSAMGEAQKQIAPTLEGGAKLANDILFSAGQMVPAVVVGAATGGAGVAPTLANALGAGVTGLTSAGSTYGNTVEEGYSPDQARLYSVINGALEAGLQYALGGIKGVSSGGILKGVAGDLSKKLASSPKVVQKIASIAASAGDEFTEEWLQGVIDSFVRNSVLGEENDINPFTWDKIYQGIIGAIMGGGSNVPSAIATPALDAKLGTETMDAIKAEDAGRAMGTVDVNTPEGRSAMVEDIEKRAQAFDAADNTFYDGKKATVEERVGSGILHSILLGDMQTARNFARTYADENFDDSVNVPSLGEDVMLSNKGIKIFLNDYLNEKNYMAFMKLPELLRKAEVIGNTPPIKAKLGRIGQVFLKSDFTMNGKPYTATISLLNTQQGYRFRGMDVKSDTNKTGPMSSLEERTHNIRLTQEQGPVLNDIVLPEGENVKMQGEAQSAEQVQEAGRTVEGETGQVNTAGNTNTETSGFLNALGEKSGVKIEIGPISSNGEQVSGAEGSYDAVTNTIRFSPESTRGDVMKGVAMHELTHSIESSEDYGAYRDFAVDYMFGGDEAAYNEAITAKQAQYAQSGAELTAEAAEKEVVAEFTRGALFADEKAVDRLVQSNPSVARRIYEAIKKAIENVKAYFGNVNSKEYLELERGRKLFERALGMRGAEQGENSQYIIEGIPNTNKQYVKADRQVIKGNTPKAWAKSVENYINRKIRNGQDVNFTAADGDILTITADTAGKAKFRNTVRLPDGTTRPMTNIEFLAKLRAESHIDELAKVSKRGKETVPDYKDHSFAKDGFNYRTAYFEDFDGQYYRVTMSVGKSGNILTIYNVGKMNINKKFSLGAQGPGGNATENFLNDSISNFDKKSNPMRH